MKILVLRNRFERELTLGYLVYFEKPKKFFIELCKNVDPIKLPIALDSFAEKGIYTINDYFSHMWVQDRVVPIDRQNIGAILKEAKLKEYDIFKLLVLADGRCTNDECELIPIDYIPKEIEERFKHKVYDAFPSGENELICFFMDETCRRINVYELRHNDRLFKYVLSHDDAFKRVSVLPGGYGVDFNNDLTISDTELYNSGTKLNIKYEDFISFIDHNVLDTYEACLQLNCTRQNINDLMHREKLKPIKQSKKNKLFLLKDINKRKEY